MFYSHKHVKPFAVISMHKKFYSSHWFLKNQIFSLFPMVKMNVNYAEIFRLGNLGGRFRT